MVEDYTKTARGSSVRQIRGCILLDENLLQIGTADKPLIIQGGSHLLQEILTELKIHSAYFQEIVGDKITEKDLED